jgi:transposase
MVLGQAGWHGSEKLTVPNNVSLAPLPPYRSELNPAECVWLILRERFLSIRVLDDQDVVIDAWKDRRIRPLQFTMLLPMDHDSQFISSAV